VDKNQFLFALKNHDSLTQSEGEELSLLLKEYPYSQVIQTLSARASHIFNFDTKDRTLQVAAVYSGDRAILKRIVTAPAQNRPSITGETVTHIENVLPIGTEQVHVESGETLLERISIDLEQLRKSKHHFEEVLEAFNRPHKAVPSSAAEAGPTSFKKPGISKRSIKEKPAEGLLDEIKSSKKKIKPKDPKQKEQIDIIDQFIKAQPNIGRPKESEGETSDLSERSVALGDQAVSETLVEILIKQGKRDKAIEVLRKLIWKFPQKKAYFAAQIEELKQ
jgi:tetratricopeptide (TPR) repeat protein